MPEAHPRSAVLRSSSATFSEHHMNDDPGMHKAACEDVKGDGTCYGCGRWMGDDKPGEHKDGDPGCDCPAPECATRRAAWLEHHAVQVMPIDIGKAVAHATAAIQEGQDDLVDHALVRVHDANAVLKRQLVHVLNGFEALVRDARETHVQARTLAGVAHDPRVLWAYDDTLRMIAETRKLT